MRKHKPTHKGKILAGIGMAVLGAVVWVVLSSQPSQAWFSPISCTDRRFFTNPSGSYSEQNIWGWSDYTTHCNEFNRHGNSVIFYKFNKPDYGDYYMTATDVGNDWSRYGTVMAKAVVSCPPGSVVEGPHRAHLFASPSINGLYDGPNHYWCSGNQNPVPGPGAGRSMPDVHDSAMLFKSTVDGQDYYTFDASSSYNSSAKAAKWSALTSGGGYVRCAYGMSGPFPTSNNSGSYHYHCLTQDGSREADFIDSGPTLEDVLITSTAPPVHSFWFGILNYAGSVQSTAAARATSKFKLQNSGNIEDNFTVNCSATQTGMASVPPMQLKTYVPTETTIGTASGAAAAATLTLAANTEKEIGVVFDIPASVAGTIQLSCSASITNRTAPAAQSGTDTVTVTAPVVTPGPANTYAAITLNPQTQLGNNKYTIKVEETDGLKEFSIKKANNTSVFGASPGAAGNVNACGGSSQRTTIESSTVTLESSDFPLQASVTDCRANSTPFTTSVSSPGGGGTGGGITLQGTIYRNGQFIDSATSATRTCTSPNGWMKEQSTAGAPRNFHCMTNYTPVSTDLPPSTCNGTLKAGNSFSEDYCSTTDGGTGGGMTLPSTIYRNGQFIDPTTNAVRICTSPNAWMKEPSTIGIVGAPRSFHCMTNYTQNNTDLPPATCNGTLKVGNSFSEDYCSTTEGGTGGSNWVQHVWTFTDGSDQSFVLDRTDREYLDFIASVDAACRLIPKNKFKWKEGAGNDAATNWQNFGIPDCSGTVTPPPPPPTGCPAGDANCIASGGYGSLSGWCWQGMKCFQKTKDTNANNDVYCAPMPTAASTATSYWNSVSCVSGYGSCARDAQGNISDPYCKEEGDRWSATDPNKDRIYCNSAQKCNYQGGAGECKAQNASCGEDALYCSQSSTSDSTKCLEPKRTEPLVAGKSYWCGQSGGMIFYSRTQVHCAERPSSGTNMPGMWSSADVKAELSRLGSEFGLCNPYPYTGGTTGTAGYSSKCIEPGGTGSSSDWCAWMPPMPPGPWSEIMTPMRIDIGGTRTCPALDGVEPPKPPVCSQVITRAYKPGTKDCKDFPNSCIPEGWIAGECPGNKPPEPPPGPRECTPEEMSGTTGGACMWPQYRLNLIEKKFEKCTEKERNLPWVNIQGNKDAKYGNCKPVWLQYEEKWRVTREKVRPAVEYGEEYNQPWDSTGKLLQYIPERDEFVDCRNIPYASSGVAPNSFMPRIYNAPCISASDERDEVWLLERERANYRMYLAGEARRPPGPVPPGPWPPGPPNPPGPVPPIPEIPKEQCGQYLFGMRQGLNGDKQFWKEIKRRLAVAPADYAGKEAVTKLLDEAKAIIVKVEKLTKKGNCSKDVLQEINTNLQRLHQEIFSQLSMRLADIDESLRTEQCLVNLDSKADQLERLLTNRLDLSARAEINGLVDAIREKEQELRAVEDYEEVDIGFECDDFLASIEPQVSALVAKYDRTVRDIIEEQTVLTREIERLTVTIEEGTKVVENLVAKVAQLQVAIQEVSKTAEDLAAQIASRAAISYGALSEVKESEQQSILAAKDRLLALIENTTKVMKETSCVGEAEQTRVLGTFSEIAAVYWTDENADSVARVINSWAEACRAKEVTVEDTTVFANRVVALRNGALREMYSRGVAVAADVPPWEWFSRAYRFAFENHLATQGRPEENVLRQDALLMIFRAMGMTDSELMGQCDINLSVTRNVSPYARCAVRRGLERGLDVYGDMSRPATRAELAYWIAQILFPNEQVDTSVLAKYTDLRGASVKLDFIDGIAKVVARGVMVGQVSPDTATFRPNDFVRRAELVVVLQKVHEQNAAR